MSNFGHDKINNLQLKEIRRLRTQGETLAAIAERFNVTAPAIRYHVKDIALPQPNKRRKGATKIDEDKILLMTGLGYSQSAIARHFGVLPSTICNALKRMERKAAA
jgi:DNA-binding CsgD family transcriptional regulator